MIHIVVTMLAVVVTLLGLQNRVLSRRLDKAARLAIDTSKHLNEVNDLLIASVNRLNTVTDCSIAASGALEVLDKRLEVLETAGLQRGHIVPREPPQDKGKPA